MDDKKALLGELQLDPHEREGSTASTRYLMIGISAVVLALVAWFWVVPGEATLAVKTSTARAATGSAGATSAAVLDASGYVTARRQATVSSKFTGKVLEVLIEEGMQVTEGQLLARLDNSSQMAQFHLGQAQIAATRARREEVEVQLKEASLNLDRTIELTGKKLASTADLDRARLAKQTFEARLNALDSEIKVGQSSLQVLQQQLDDTEIRAPFDGVVIAKAAQPGEMISPVSAGGGFTRTGICTIVDMNSLEVEVDVNEAYINRVSPGQPVTATLNSYQDWQIPAEVITIIPTADRNKATVRVRIGFKQGDSRILPDMGVKVSFMNEQPADVPAEKALNGVLIPGSAVATVDDMPTVFVVKDGIAEARQIVVGVKRGSSRNITSGLQVGERVITDLAAALANNLKAGQQVLADEEKS